MLPTIRIGGQLTKSLYQFTLQSPDTEELYRSATLLEAKWRDVPGLQDVASDLQIKNPQINVVIDRDLKKQIHPEGRPVAGGFISSYFGEREDPFSGEEAYHKGVDFAGTAGANVMAVAAGVVTWAGNRTGYGNLVEINHGDGYITRYAHNQRTLVSVGQTVKRGDPIALMGSTGRSTGPHVHFEVVRNGRQVDPLSFIGRK